MFSYKRHTLTYNEHDSISKDNVNELSNHGILGQKWGVRPCQNADASSTKEDKKQLTLDEILKDY